MIELRNVSKTYGDQLAVDSVDLTINLGEVCVIIGPSGCGKSTTLKMINRMIDPSSGTVYIEGRKNTEEKPELLRRTIGYVIQSIGLFPHRNVRDNIALVPGLLKWDRVKTDNRVLELMKLVGLDPAVYATKYPHELSGGEAQRIGVARALAADPPILLMDEPFGAVDPLGRLVLQNEFLSIQRRLKKTVVFVTHDLDEAIRLADRIAIMRDGKIVQYDTPEMILTKPANSFVRDFVGSDRSLKKLARYSAKHSMHEPVAVQIDDASLRDNLESLHKEGSKFAWAVDSDLRLHGWVDVEASVGGTDPMEGYTDVHADEVAVGPEDSLKSVLSRMLGQGIKNVPVIDTDSKLVGEISLGDIEQITET